MALLFLQHQHPGVKGIDLSCKSLRREEILREYQGLCGCSSSHDLPPLVIFTNFPLF